MHEGALKREGKIYQLPMGWLNFLSAHVVGRCHRNVGWRGGMCAYKGRLDVSRKVCVQRRARYYLKRGWTCCCMLRAEWLWK